MNEVVSPRVMLAAKFPAQYIEETIVPSLRAIGVAVERVVSTEFEGQIKDVDAVLFMFQYCSHVSYNNFKAAAKAAGVKFALLERQSANWPHALRKAGIPVPGRPIDAKPLPVPVTLPPAPKWWPQQEAHENEPEPVEAKAEPTVAVEPAKQEALATTFGQALLLARRAGRHSQADVAAVCDVDQSAVSKWERDHAVQREHYQKLVELFPALKDTPAPPFATRPGPGKRQPVTNGHTVHVGTVSVATFAPSPEVEIRTALPEPERLPPILPVVAPKTNGHSHHRPPLESLLRAARAVGIQGPVTVTVDDAGTVVRVGGEEFPGAFDDAVEKARAVLVERLREQQRRASELLAELAGAA